MKHLIWVLTLCLATGSAFAGDTIKVQIHKPEQRPHDASFCEGYYEASGVPFYIDVKRKLLVMEGNGRRGVRGGSGGIVGSVHSSSPDFGVVVTAASGSADANQSAIQDNMKSYCTGVLNTVNAGGVLLGRELAEGWSAMQQRDTQLRDARARAIIEEMPQEQRKEFESVVLDDPPPYTQVDLVSCAVEHPKLIKASVLDTCQRVVAGGRISSAQLIPSGLHSWDVHDNSESYCSSVCKLGDGEPGWQSCLTENNWRKGKKRRPKCREEWHSVTE